MTYGTLAKFIVVLVATAIVAAALLSGYPTPGAAARTTDVGAFIQSPRASVWMSDVEDGERRRSLPADTSLIWAVVGFEDAEGDRYKVEMQDLAGNTVVSATLPPVSGTARRSIAISIVDIVGSYLRAIGEILSPTPGGGETVMGIAETVELVQTLCGVRPELPDPWPPVLPTPNPGEPTPAPAPPDPYTQWLSAVLNPIDSSQLLGAELRRKLIAVNALPEMAAGGEGASSAASFASAITALDGVEAGLSEARTLLKPADTGIRPAPERACTLIDSVKANLDRALEHVEAGLGDMPDDVSGWAFPPTEARYSGRTFLDCQQYLTSLSVVTPSEPGGTTVDTESWTLGDTGPTALIFPAANLTDSSNVGTLRLSPTGGASAIYALGVVLEGLNHTATIAGYVTDRNCNPVDGQTIALSIEPPSGGTLSSVEAITIDGDFSVQYEAPDDVPPPNPDDGRRVDIAVSAMSPDDATVAATTQFNVIGKASNFRFIVNPRNINRLAPYIAPTARPGFPTPTPAPRDPYSSGRLRGGITVEVKDVNGANVADGTVLSLNIQEGDPGLLAYERRVRGTTGTELVQAGKSIDLITRGGNSVVMPEIDDPGVTNLEGLYLIPGPDGDGFVTLEAEADGNRANSDDPTLGEPTILIFSRVSIHLPLVLKNGHPLPASPRPTRTVPRADP